MKKIVILIAILAAAGPTSPSSADKQLKMLKSRLKAFLTQRDQSKTAGVAAVRGSASLDALEDLDIRLGNHARLFRQNLMQGKAAPRAEDSLRRIYRALAVGSFMKAAGIGDAKTKSEAAAVLKGLSSQLGADGASETVLALLSGPKQNLNLESLLRYGWAAHVKSLTSGLQQTFGPGGGKPQPQTAELDEILTSVQDARQETLLSPKEESEAYMLQGIAYRGLSAADFSPLAGGEPSAGIDLPPEEEPAGERPVPPPFDPTAVYRRASPSVVFILCSSDDGTGGMGSGTVVDGRGAILTNAHVVVRDSTRQPWESVRVYFKPRRMTGDPNSDLKSPVTMKVKAWDPSIDLALLEPEGRIEPPKPLSLGDPRDVEIGDRVMAIGHPEQGGLWTLTTGVISTLVAELGGVKGKRAFQTDASINKGNSGGPLLDAYGNIIGVNTSMSRTGADGAAITAINFAVRADVVRHWLSKKGLVLAYARPAALPSTLAPPAALMGGAGGAAQGVMPAPAAASMPMEMEERSMKKEMSSYQDSFDQGASESAQPMMERSERRAPAARARTMAAGALSGASAASKPSVPKMVTEGKPYSIDRFLKQKLKSGR